MGPAGCFPFTYSLCPRPLCAASVELSKKPLSPCGTKGAILFLSKLQKSLILTHKRTQVKTPLITPHYSPQPCLITLSTIFALAGQCAEGC